MSPAATPRRDVTRLPPGRHKLSRAEVRESQQRRLREAALESLLVDGYGAITTTAVARRAGISTATLYRYRTDLWDCLRDACEAGGSELARRIEGACAGNAGAQANADPGNEPATRVEPAARVEAGVRAALSLLDCDPGLAYLLGAEPPLGATALRAARREAIDRLAALLAAAGRQGGPAAERPDPGDRRQIAGRERRQIAAALRLLAARARGEGTVVPAGEGTTPSAHESTSTPTGESAAAPTPSPLAALEAELTAVLLRRPIPHAVP